MRTLVGAAGGAISGAASGAVTGGAMGAINYLRSCGSDCNWSAGLNATASAAGDGALMGAAMGAVGGAFGGAFSRGNKPSSGGCLGKSFDEDTPVAMADGSTKPIRDVQPGDEVTATDPESGLTGARLVTATHINHDDDLVDVTVAAAVGTGAAAVIQTTANHPFWDDTTDTWTLAGELTVGHELRTDDGLTATVAAVTSRPGTQDMYDLTVEATHTFYVLAGSTPVLVHNCGQVEYGSTDLSQQVIQTRLNVGRTNGNGAAARIVDAAGNERFEVAFASKGPKNHAEQKLLRLKLSPGETIKEIYSERRACTGSNNCRVDLANLGIDHSWSFPWEKSGTAMATTSNNALNAKIGQVFRDALSGNWTRPWD
jgi:hypothetical protein